MSSIGRLRIASAGLTLSSQRAASASRLLAPRLTKPRAQYLSTSASRLAAPARASQGGPIPRPASASPGQSGRSGWISVLVTSQLTLFGVALLGIGYFIGQSTAANSTAEVLESVNTSLQPSVIGIANQEARQPVYGSLGDYELAIRELKDKWGKKGKGDKVSTDKEDLDTHGVSDWSYHEAKRPTVVVWADSTEEVQEVVLLARRYRVPITPFSGGTSLEGHFSSVSRARRAARCVMWPLRRTAQIPLVG